jgi:hypothetical protein
MKRDLLAKLRLRPLFLISRVIAGPLFVDLLSGRGPDEEGLLGKV